MTDVSSNRDDDFGIAIVVLRCDVSDERLTTELANIDLSFENNGITRRRRQGDMFIVAGKRQNVKRLSQLDFVSRFAFEADHKPLLEHAD